MSEIDELVDNLKPKKYRIHIGRKTEEKKDLTVVKPSLDTIQEQIESPMTTIYCPQSIKKDELKNIDRSPEKYIEINLIKKIRVVDNFFIPSNLHGFDYKDKHYNIIEENIYIFPTKKNFFMPTSFYYEDRENPIDFKNENTGITGKALSLLYKPSFYEGLHDPDENKYNLFIVICLCISIGTYIVGLYYWIKSITGV